MVVNGETLIRIVIVELKRAEARARRKFLHQLKAQLAREEQVVVARGHGVTLRQTRDGAVEAVGRQDDVISLVDHALDGLEFGWRILFVVGQIADAVAERAAEITGRLL